MSSLRFAFLLCLFFLLNTGCARMIGAHHDVPWDAQSREDARNLLDSVLAANPAPKTFKGIGNARLIANDVVQSARLAWAASSPDMVRMEILTPYGQPAVSFSTDGRNAYAIVHREKKFYKSKALRSSLERILGISIEPAHLVSVMAGQAPVLDYSFISMAAPETGAGPVILLQEKWWGDYEKIHLAPDSERIRAAEIFDSDGKLKYRVVFGPPKKAGKYSAPSRLTVSNAEGEQASLEVSRFWADVQIPASTFVLKSPGG